jgi:hypothetical protein
MVTQLTVAQRLQLEELQRHFRSPHEIKGRESRVIACRRVRCSPDVLPILLAAWRRQKVAGRETVSWHLVPTILSGMLEAGGSLSVEECQAIVGPMWTGVRRTLTARRLAEIHGGRVWIGVGGRARAIARAERPNTPIISTLLCVRRIIRWAAGQDEPPTFAAAAVACKGHKHGPRLQSRLRLLDAFRVAGMFEPDGDRLVLTAEGLDWARWNLDVVG